MRAIVQDEYGSADVLHLKEIPGPTVGDGDVLVRVRAASVHPDIWHVMRGEPYVLRLMGAGLRRPNVLVPGTDVAGVVESVGANATRFTPGDPVFGESVRGHQWHNGGAYAEYASVPEGALERKPDAVGFEEAAAVPTSGFIALSGLRDEGRIASGERVLINGAAGGVGSLAVQIARANGAHVTGVDAAGKLDMLRTLGADAVLDYAKEDFTQGDERYDLILDIPGTRPFSACRRALTPAGRYVLIGHAGFGRAGGRWLGGVPRALGLTAMSAFVKQLPDPRFSSRMTDHMAVLRGLLETGDLTPIVDRTFPLSEVPDAIRYMEQGQARGRIIITV